ncbi:tRNA (guanine-N(7)-)-methyltransferase (tRNA(m7G46)-methyltransferase), partial [Coemansia sp. RSA 2599]
MYGWVVAGARQIAWYIVLTPLLLGALITTLLLTNLLISYWFQQRVRQTRMPSVALKPSPPVSAIPRLAFANELPRHLTSSLVASEYSSEGWQKPVVDLHGHRRMEEQAATVLGLVVRDFVEAWFGEISADVSFPRCVYKQIVGALESIVERVRGVDLAECIVGVCLPLVTAHLRSIRDGAGDMESIRWHPALSAVVAGDDEVQDSGGEKKAVMAHVRRVVDLITPLVLPPDQASFGPHRVLVREILTGALLGPVVQSLADPDTINQLVDGQLEKLIQEQHMVRELRDVLDQQAEDASRQSVDEEERAREVSEDAMVRTYDQFMAIIDECSDARELERIRDDILAQIRKRRILIMGQNKDDIVHGQRVGDVIVYVNRLYVAKKKAERRLDQLRKHAAEYQQSHYSTGNSGNGGSTGAGVVGRRVVVRKSAASRVSTYYEHRDDPTKLGPPQFTLREILTNVSSLSAFAEYMDLIGSQFLLEFWVNVEGVRQPRPEVFPSIVASLWKTYFTLRVDELAEAGDNVEAAITRVQRCLKPLRLSGSLDLDVSGLTVDLCTEALGLICLVQEAVFKHMETSVFPAFLRSAFYSRVLKEYYVTPRQDQLSEKLFSQEAGKADSSLQQIAEEEGEESGGGKSSRSSIKQTAAPVAKSISGSGSSGGVASPRQPARRLSLVRSVAGSLGRRSASGGSLSHSAGSIGGITGIGSIAGIAGIGSGNGSGGGGGRKWNLNLLAKPEAPLVSTTTAVVESTPAQAVSEMGRRRERSIVQLTEALAEQSPRQEPRSLPKPTFSRPQTPAAPMSVRSLPLEQAEGAEPLLERSESAQPFGELGPTGPPAPVRRRSVRVGRSEVRRLSASLRSIALSSGEIGEDGGLQMTPLETALAPTDDHDSGTSAIASHSEHESSDEERGVSADEAESLVLARVLTTPAPGDLFIDERVALVSRDIARKTHQMAIVRALMKQAETRHRGNEQRVLRSSYRALQREVREAQEQERLYLESLDDHRLTKTRTRVHIPRAIMRDEDGDSHVTYLIEVQQGLPAQYAGRAGDGRTRHAPMAGWVVARRYREFFAMHRDLKALVPLEMRGNELPSRTPLIRLQKDRDIEHRRAGLERYLQGLLADPSICAAMPLKLFLSSTAPPDPGLLVSGERGNGQNGDDDDDAGRVAGWMASIHKTVGQDIEGVTGADSMLELIVQELGAQ